MGLPAADSAPQEGREVCICTWVHMCVTNSLWFVDVISPVLSPSESILSKTMKRYRQVQ